MKDRYNANLTKGPLKLSESRIVAALLLQDPTRADWDRAILVDNVLQTRSPSTAKTLADYLAHRLRTMTPPLWELVRDAPNAVASQAAFAAAIKYSPLLGDFMDLSLREEIRQFKTYLSPRAWTEYVESCTMRDPKVVRWTTPVLDKLRQNVCHMLVEAGYLSDTRSLKFQTVHLAPSVQTYLEAENEEYVLRCMQVTS